MNLQEIESRGFVEKLKDSTTTAVLKKLCDQLNIGHPYKVIVDEEYNHEWGRGGHRKSIVQLLKEDQPVIISFYDNHWDTTSDDSTDYDQGSTHQLYLMQEDPIARQIFESLRSLTRAA